LVLRCLVCIFFRCVLNKVRCRPTTLHLGPIVKHNRRSHHNWTKQHAWEEMASWSLEEVEERISWIWEEVLARHESLLGKQAEAARVQRRQRGSRPRRKPERQPPKYCLKGHTGWLAEPGIKPEPTPRTHRGESVTRQAPCFAVIRTVSPVRIHSPVRDVPAPRTCRAKVVLCPGSVVPALRSRPPVHLHAQYILRPLYVLCLQ
jgi:hypothetical protein